MCLAEMQSSGSYCRLGAGLSRSSVSFFLILGVFQDGGSQPPDRLSFPMCLIWIDQVELQALVTMGLLWDYKPLTSSLSPPIRGCLSREETAMVDTRQHAVQTFRRTCDQGEKIYGPKVIREYSNLVGAWALRRL